MLASVRSPRPENTPPEALSIRGHFTSNSEKAWLSPGVRPVCPGAPAGLEAVDVPIL